MPMTLSDRAESETQWEGNSEEELSGAFKRSSGGSLKWRSQCTASEAGRVWTWGSHDGQHRAQQRQSGDAEAEKQQKEGGLSLRGSMGHVRKQQVGGLSKV